MKEFILAQDELDKLCVLIPNEAIVLLSGDLASGKTSLVKAIAKQKGIKQDINSPTFSIMQSYEAKECKIYHYDIYQNGIKAILQNGLFENFFEKALHLVEWGDEILQQRLKLFDLHSIVIKIDFFNDKRKYEFYE